MRNNQAYEFFVLATILDPHIRLASFVDDFEGEVLNVGLHLGVGKFATNETFGVEDTAKTISMID